MVTSRGFCTPKVSHGCGPVAQPLCSSSRRRPWRRVQAPRMWRRCPKRIPVVQGANRRCASLASCPDRPRCTQLFQRLVSRWCSQSASQVILSLRPQFGGVVPSVCARGLADDGRDSGASSIADGAASLSLAPKTAVVLTAAALCARRSGFSRVSFDVPTSNTPSLLGLVHRCVCPLPGSVNVLGVARVLPCNHASC